MQEAKGWHSRGYLPHFDSPGIIQHVVFRTFVSLPKAVFNSLPADMQLRRRAVDQQLDLSLHGNRLADASSAAIIENALAHDDGVHYNLLAWCVMPNHVHVVIEQREGRSLGAIVRSWKTISAQRINALHHAVGPVWAIDYFDRCIRDEKHLAMTVEYVESNPVKARLAGKPQDWPFGSARLP